MIAEHFIRKWQDAGLIDPAAAKRIRDWENAHRRPVWLWAVAGTGALAIALGVMAIVGANWEDIPDVMKLGAHLAVTVACAIAVFFFSLQQREWPREISAILLFGLILAGIALIGQVYQLQSDVWRALVLWLALGTPFLALTALTPFTGVLWGLAAVTTWFSASDRLVDTPLDFYLAACALIVIAAARALWLPARRQADTLMQLAFAGLVVTCSFVVAVPGATRHDGSNTGAAITAIVATLIAAAALWRWQTEALRYRAMALLAFSLVAWLLALWIGDDRGMPGDIARAAVFIAYWAAIGGMAAQAGWRTWFGVAFTMVGLRLLVLYLEAIGGLTATGFGLLGGGVLCIALAGIGWRLTRRVARAPDPGRAAP